MTKAEHPYELLVIGGSAGSLTAVLKIIQLLGRAITVPIIIIFHRKQAEEGTLIEVLSRRTIYAVKETEDKDDILPSTLYIAPADYHVLIENDRSITLDDSEKINYSRPSIDVTFESAAEVYGNKLACLLLSGANADGVGGLKAAKASGAFIAVQDPNDAEVSFMPQQAVDQVEIDFLVDSHNLDKFLDLFR